MSLDWKPVAMTLSRRLARVALVLSTCLVLQACKVSLYTNLDERQANEITAILVQQGIPAGREVEKGGKLTVMVEESRFADAVLLLKEEGLPRQEFATLGDVFKKEGLVASPVQERAQMIYALSQELSRTVSSIDGVLSARVHLVLPENDPLKQNLVPSSASVFIRHRDSVPLRNHMSEIKMLVANGISGLAYDKVTVVLIPVNQAAKPAGTDPGLVSFMGLWLHPTSVQRAMWLIYSLIGLALAGMVGGAVVVLRRRQRDYAIQPMQTVKP